MISLGANLGLYPYGVSWMPNLLTNAAPALQNSFHILTENFFLLQVGMMSLEANFGLFLDGNFLITKFAFKLTRGRAVF